MLRTLDEFNNNGGASGWDGWDNYIGSHERDHWLIVLGRNRDSDILANSNFECALEELGSESEDVEVHSFGHWACGWFELILICPGPRKVVATAEDIRKRLEDYPILDESDYSEREYESYCEQWESRGRSDFVQKILNAFDLDDDSSAEELIANSPELDNYFREHSCYGHSSEEMSADTENVVRVMDWSDLDDLVEYKVEELKQAALIEASKRGLDPFDESLRWHWDDQVRFPWEDLV